MPKILHTLVMLMAFAFTASVLPNAATAQSSLDSSVFSVRDVQADVTADNAAAARELAFTKAQQDAFTILASRILSKEERENFVLPDESTIASFVKDFEIISEQSSSVRYIGTYTFSFKKDVVGQYLSGRNYTYTDVGSKPVLILPFLHADGVTTLWNGDNPWKKAWESVSGYQGLVPVILPIGDLQDVSDIQDSQALNYNAESLANMVKRYKVGEAIIALAIKESDTKATVMLYKTFNGSPELVKRLEIKADDYAAKSVDALYNKAVNKTRDVIQDEWKTKTLVYGTLQPNMLRARVPFKSMKEWVDTQKTLRNIQGIDDIDLLGLTSKEAMIEIHFTGNENCLRVALN